MDNIMIMLKIDLSLFLKRIKKMCCLLSSVCWWLAVFGCLVSLLTVANMTREVCGCRSGYWDPRYVGYEELTGFYARMIGNSLLRAEVFKEVCAVTCHLPQWLF